MTQCNGSDILTIVGRAALVVMVVAILAQIYYTIRGKV